jgi:hypothetical protein
LYLPGAVIRKTAEGLWSPAENETDEYLKRHWLLLIQSMARQLKDPKMFEKARLACWPTLSVASCVDIAGAYLESGDAQTALNWLQKIPSSEQFQADQRDVLLFEAYEKLGDRKNQEQTGWRIFRRYRSENTLAVLLSVIGVGQKEGVIKDEAKIIIQSEKLSYSDAGFLIQAGCLDEAEAYLMERRDQVDGDFYQLLLSLADSLEKCGRLLAASLLYRKLLESILKRAVSKYYTHGVRYLKKLDALADKISDWRDVKPHPDYFQELKTNHGRKPSFWAKYQK